MNNLVPAARLSLGLATIGSKPVTVFQNMKRHIVMKSYDLVFSYPIECWHRYIE